MAVVHERGWDPARLSHPWLWPYGERLARFREHADWPSFAELEAELERARASAGLAPLRLSLSPAKKKKRKRREPLRLESLYDLRVAEQGVVPTRASDWHDFFNVLAFATWPRAKHALHARHARLLRARLVQPVHRLPGARTREQDALTLFDEGGVAIACTAAHMSALAAPEVALDALLPALLARGEIDVLPFGHALAEHLVAGLPCPLSYAHVVRVDALPAAPEQRVHLVDRALAAALAEPALFVAPSGVKGVALERLSPRDSA